MALFKIEKGTKANLDKNRGSCTNGYCYVTTDEHKMYIDIASSEDTSGRICLNAAEADVAGSLKEINYLQVNLASTVPGQFDGSGGDTILGVSGVLPIKNGGTNANSQQSGYTNLVHTGLLDEDIDMSFSRGIITYTANGPSTPGEWEGGAIYNFIPDKVGVATSSHWQIAFDRGSVSPYIRLNSGTSNLGSWEKILTTSSIDAYMGNYLPLSAGESKKLTGPLGFSPESEMYGTELPTNGFNGQLFFLEDEGATLPEGGSAGYALVKASSADGDDYWASPAITWVAGTSVGPKPKIFGVTGSAIPKASATASGIVTTGAQKFAGDKTFKSSVTVSDSLNANGSFTAKGEFEIYGANPHIDFHFNNSTADYTSRIIETSAGVLSSTAKFYGAVWNDYAEFRTQKEYIEPGYCVASANNGQVYKTTEKFQACDGIVSDTFGFAIGETNECKTPLAVAGRVLAYFHGNREDYQAGDTVCAGPEGKVMKMTREEIKEYPDRIIGIVSEIPEYETWGSGNVEVNNRIWIKVK